MNYKLINKIAKKIILSFKEIFFYEKYNVGIKKGIIFYNYFNFPVSCGFKRRNDYFLLTCNNEKQAYEKVFDSDCKSALEIKKYLNENGNTLSNFKKIIKNYFFNNGITQKDDYLVKSIQKLNYNDFRKKLNNNYDLNLFYFNKVFNDETSQIYQLKISEMIFKSLQPINQKLIKKIYNKLNSLLPSSLSSKLLYGEFELKKLNDNTAALWTSDDNIILDTSYEFNDVVRYLIHELSHRWYYKFASPQQIKEFRKLFNNAQGKYINLEIADIITFIGDDDEYIYAGIDKNGKMLLESLNAKLSYHKKIDVRQFDTINGQKIEKYIFPSDYSKTRFTEFVPECIAYCYCNELEDKNLEQKIKEIIG